MRFKSNDSFEGDKQRLKTVVNSMSSFERMGSVKYGQRGLFLLLQGLFYLFNFI